MADDGGGMSIHIPSFLISYKNGQLLKEFISQDRHVVIKTRLGITTPENSVVYELWYSSAIDFLSWDLASLELS